MSLKNVTKTDNTKAVIEFAVDAETFEKAVNAVYNKKKANLTLPGFRKGTQKPCRKDVRQGLPV